MLLKIIVYGEDWGYWTVEDYSEYADAFETDDEFHWYVREGVFYPDEQGIFHNKFVAEWLESMYLYEKDIIKVEVIRVYDVVED